METSNNNERTESTPSNISSVFNVSIRSELDFKVIFFFHFSLRCVYLSFIRIIYDFFVERLKMDSSSQLMIVIPKYTICIFHRNLFVNF